MKLRHLLTSGLLLVLALSPLARAGEGANVVARFPGKDVAGDNQLCADLLKLGPAGIAETCAMLQPLTEPDGKDVPARYALTALSRYAGRPGAEAERKMVSAALGQAISGAADPEVKSFFINRLRDVGGDEAVPALRGFLSDEKLCHHACAALERIATPAATGALLEALPNAAGTCRLSVVRSLGVLRAPAAAAEVRKSATAPETDRALRATALWALASIGQAEDGKLLAGAARTASGSRYDVAKSWSAYLLWLRRQAEQGRRDEAAAELRAIVKGAPEGQAHLAGAALTELATALGEVALDDLKAAATSPDIRLRAVALAAAQKLPGPGVTAAFGGLLATAEAGAKADLLGFLEARKDASALAAVLGQLQDKDAAVRLAAATAAVAIDAAAATKPVIDLLGRSPAAEAKPLAELLGRVKGDAVVPALAAALASAAPAARPAIIEVLAARAARSQKAAVLAQASADDAGTRAAAFKALEKLGDAADAPKLIELAMAAKADADEQAALRAAVAVSQGAAADARSEPFLAALASAPAAKRSALLRATGKVGGKKALDAVVAELGKADAAARDAAIRALAEWPDSAAVAPLLSIASGEAPAGGAAYTQAQQIIALRGAVQVLKNSALGSDQKVQGYAKALAAAKRPEEKRLVLAALSAERTPAAVDLAAPLLDDDALKAEAALAVVKIVVPLERGQKGLKGEKVAAALTKAAPLCPDPKARGEAQKYLKTMK